MQQMTIKNEKEILEAIDQLRRRKARPCLDKIANLLLRRVSTCALFRDDFPVSRNSPRDFVWRFFGTLWGGGRFFRKICVSHVARFFPVTGGGEIDMIVLYGFSGWNGFLPRFSILVHVTKFPDERKRSRYIFRVFFFCRSISRFRGATSRPFLAGAKSGKTLRIR